MGSSCSSTLHPSFFLSWLEWFWALLRLVWYLRTDLNKIICTLWGKVSYKFFFNSFLLRAHTNWGPKGAMEKGAGTHAKGIFNSCPGGTECQERDLPNKAAAFWASPRRISAIAQNVWGWQSFLCQLWVFSWFTHLPLTMCGIKNNMKGFYHYVLLWMKILTTEVRHCPLTLLFRDFHCLLGLLECAFLTLSRDISQLVSLIISDLAVVMLCGRKQRQHWMLLDQPLSSTPKFVDYSTLNMEGRNVSLGEAFCRSMVGLLTF